MSDNLPWTAVLAGAVLCVVGVNAAVGVSFSDPDVDAVIPGVRKPDVLIIPKDAATPLPVPGDRPVVLLVGNSHQYGLPGLAQGEPLRPDSGGTVAYELMQRLRPEAEGAVLARLSYPNFLPFEMLARLYQLQRAGWAPKAAIVAIHWANLARGEEVRDKVAKVFEDDALVAAMRADLSTAASADDALLLAEVDRQARRVADDRERERLRSQADHSDIELTAWLQPRVPVMGHSTDLRASLYRGIVNRAQQLLTEGGEYSYSRGAVDRDLAFNLAGMRRVLRLLRERGTEVLLYHPPVRQDLPEITDTARRAETFAALVAYAESIGCSWADASPVVPGQYWGWVDDFPDRAHFTEPGHVLLAEFLFKEGARAGLWPALRRERHAVQ